MRIRNKWRSGKKGSIGENATAAAYIIWQVGLHFTKHLHEEKFEFESDNQRIAVLGEYLHYLSHVVDRLSHDHLTFESRQEFMTVLGNQVARHYQRNSEEILGSGDYRQQFLDDMNQRFAQYSRGDFENGEPGYSARRLLGNSIQEIMGMSQSNRWIIQQVIDIDAPDAAQELIKGLGDLVEITLD